MEYTVKAITGCVLSGCPVIALLFLGLLFTGVLLDERNRTLHPKSPAMRLSQPRMEFMSKQMDLALNEKLYTFDDVEKFIIKTGAELSECRTLTPKILNMLIERIEVHKSEKIDGKKRVKVDVYFTAIGMIDIPTEAEIATLTEEIKNNPDKMELIA